MSTCQTMASTACSCHRSLKCAPVPTTSCRYLQKNRGSYKMLQDQSYRNSSLDTPKNNTRGRIMRRPGAAGCPSLAAVTSERLRVTASMPHVSSSELLAVDMYTGFLLMFS